MLFNQLHAISVTQQQKQSMNKFTQFIKQNKALSAVIIITVVVMFQDVIFPLVFLFLIIFLVVKKLNPSFNFKNMAKIFDAQTEAVNSVKMPSFKSAKKMTFVIVGAVVLIILLMSSLRVIDAGQVGVFSLFGKVKDQELKSGLHLINPLGKITKMSIRTEEYTMSVTQGEGKRISADAINSLTKEGLSVDLDITVLYRLDSEKASDVYQTVGEQYDEKIIRPAVRTAIRDVIANYEAKDIYSQKRQEVAQNIQKDLEINLSKRGIVLEEVLLRNVALPDNLEIAIQEKLQAEQEAQKYDFLLQREEKEKERKKVEAEGQREAQRIITESLTTDYLYYLYVNNLKEREGTIYVPTNPNTGMPLFRELGR